MYVVTGSASGLSAGAAVSYPSVLPGVPRIVFAFPQTTALAYYRTDTMGTNESKPMTGGTALVTTAITGMTASQFTIGATLASVDFHWVAVYGTTSEIYTGTTVGTGTNHTETPAFATFLPVLLMAASASTHAAVFRTSGHTSTNSNTWTATQSSTNGISSLASNGFGVQGTQTNNTGTTYHWVGFAAVSGVFSVNTYVGNGPSDPYTVTGQTTYPPDVTLIKARGAAVNGVVRTRHNVGDLTADLGNAAAAADLIQAFNSTGFEVGGDTQVNGTNANTFITINFKEYQPVEPALVTNTSTVYAPTVENVASGQTVNPSLVTNTNTLYDPNVTSTVTASPSLHTNTSTVYAPTVTPGGVTASPSLVTNSSTLYAPTVTPGAVTASPALHTNTSDVFVPTLTPGVVTVAPALLTNVSTPYAPTITTGVVTVNPALVTNTPTVYLPNVSAGDAPAQEVTPGLVTNTSSVYAPSVQPGGVTASPALVTNDPSFYAPSVILGTVTLTPALLTNMPELFTPTLTPGGVTLNPALVTNLSAVYTPTASNVAPPLVPVASVTGSTYLAVSVTGSTALAASVIGSPSLTANYVGSTET